MRDAIGMEIPLQPAKDKLGTAVAASAGRIKFLCFREAVDEDSAARPMHGGLQERSQSAPSIGLSGKRGSKFGLDVLEAQP